MKCLRARTDNNIDKINQSPNRYTRESVTPGLNYDESEESNTSTDEEQRPPSPEFSDRRKSVPVTKNYVNQALDARKRLTRTCTKTNLNYNEEASKLALRCKMSNAKPPAKKSREPEKNISKISKTTNVKKLVSLHTSKLIEFRKSQEKQREMSQEKVAPEKQSSAKKRRMSFFHNNDDPMRIDLFEKNNIKFISDGKFTFKLEIINKEPLIVSLYSTTREEDPHPYFNLSVSQVINLYHLLGNLATIICKSEELIGKTLVFANKDKYDARDINIMYGNDIGPMEEDNENILENLDNVKFETVDGMFECLWFLRPPWDQVGYIKLYPNGSKKLRKAKFFLVFWIMSGSSIFTINKMDAVAEKGSNIRVHSNDKYSIRNHTDFNCILKIIKFH